MLHLWQTTPPGGHCRQDWSGRANDKTKVKASHDRKPVFQVGPLSPEPGGQADKPGAAYRPGLVTSGVSWPADRPRTRLDAAMKSVIAQVPGLQAHGA